MSNLVENEIHRLGWSRHGEWWMKDNQTPMFPDSGEVLLYEYDQLRTKRRCVPVGRIEQLIEIFGNGKPSVAFDCIEARQELILLLRELQGRRSAANEEAPMSTYDPGEFG